jgi:hypothetical protein
MLARWKPGQENNKGRKVDLGVGQLQGGYEYLSERWNWTVKQVRLFLSKLMGESMIEKAQPTLSTPINLSEQKKMQKPGSKKGKQTNNQIQVITLCNYRKYQVAHELLELEKGQATGQPRGKRGASEGQDLNTVTLKQETTLQRANTNPDIDVLETKLLDACNGAAANPAVAPGILTLTEPLKWLQHGCDLELDILPTIRARSHKLRPGSVKNWSYFTQAVADAKASREAPMPEGNARQPASGGWRDEEAERRKKLRDALEKVKAEYNG